MAVDLAPPEDEGTGTGKADLTCTPPRPVRAAGPVGDKHGAPPRTVDGAKSPSGTPRSKRRAVEVSVEGQEVTVPPGTWEADGRLTLTASDIRCTLTVNVGLAGKRSAQAVLRVGLTTSDCLEFGSSPQALGAWATAKVAGYADLCIGPQRPSRPGSPAALSPDPGICHHEWRQADEGCHLSPSEALEFGSGACAIGFSRRLNVEVKATRTIRESDDSVTLHVQVMGEVQLRPWFRPTGRAGARGLYEAARAQFRSGADDDAIRKCTTALSIHEELDAEHREAGDVLNLLGTLYARKAMHEAGIESLTRALTIREKALGPSDPATAATLMSLGGIHQQLKAYGEAAKCQARAVEILRAKLGTEHISVASALSGLADARREVNCDEALLLYEQALAIREKALGSEHHLTASTLSNLGTVHQRMGKHRDAARVFQRALAAEVKSLGAEHPATATTLNNLGIAHEALGEYKTATDCHARALKICEQKLGPNHADTATTLHNLGNARARLGQGEEAARCYWGALTIWNKSLGSGSTEIATTLHSLGNVYRGLEEPDNAEKCLSGALKIREHKLGRAHPETARTLHSLGLVRCGLDQHLEALKLLAEAANSLEAALGVKHPWALQARADTAALEAAC